MTTTVFSSWIALLPEMLLLSFISIILLVDLWIKNPKSPIPYGLSQIALIALIVCCYCLLNRGTFTLLKGTYVFDNLGLSLKMIIFGVGLFVFYYSRKYTYQHHLFKSEYYLLCLFSILGMMVLISAKSFLTLFLGLELITLPLYALIAMAKEAKDTSEAAIKYFVMGGMASGMLLFGVSLLYGATGSFEMAGVAHFLAQNPFDISFATLFGMVFVLVGFGFKLGSVPFHMWVPDVYEGAQTPVTLFIGTLSKLASFGFGIRILTEAFPSLSPHWQPLFVLMALLSLIVGNLGALVQDNLKRMLAYSTISHIGFLFLGFLAGPTTGYASAFVYIVIYALMVLTAFGIIIALSYQGFEAENISDFKGLGETHPWIALMMLLAMFSLAGVPPTAGFYAKFVVLDALISAGYTWLAVVAVIFSVIGAYYYLRVVRVMFFEQPLGHEIIKPLTRGNTLVVSINGLLMLAFGIYPVPIINWSLALFQAPS